MINARGVVVVLFFSALSLAAGFAQANHMWRNDRTRLSSTGMLCKGDRLK
jgi:hypothetical protein